MRVSLSVSSERQVNEVSKRREVGLNYRPVSLDYNYDVFQNTSLIHYM